MEEKNKEHIYKLHEKINNGLNYTYNNTNNPLKQANTNNDIKYYKLSCNKQTPYTTPEYLNKIIKQKTEIIHQQAKTINELEKNLQKLEEKNTKLREIIQKILE